jgi:hypothetical protein
MRNYIGSTKGNLQRRLARHIYSSRRGSRTAFHRHISELTDGAQLIVFNVASAETLEEARALENEHITRLNTVGSGLNERYESSTCSHGIKRALCTPCGGSQSRCAEHNTIRYQCNKGDCATRASNICEHKTQRAQCSICAPHVCGWCDAKLTRSGYIAHVTSHKHRQALTPDLGWLFGDD